MQRVSAFKDKSDNRWRVGLVVSGLVLVLLAVLDVVAVSIFSASVYGILLLAVPIAAGIRSDGYREAARTAVVNLGWFTVPSGVFASLLVITRFPEYSSAAWVIVDLLLGWILVGLVGAVLACATQGILRVAKGSSRPPSWRSDE